jgi:anaerobic ribonucleoside-triphosphate reductase
LAKVLLASLDKSEVKLYLEKQNEDVETHELMEFTSDKKKGKIKLDFEKEIISTNISEAEKQAIELEMNDLDVSELESDI